MTRHTTRLVDGNEAVAWAAAECGLDYFAHYPGSPVNRIEPCLKDISGRYGLGMRFNDALNEHVAALAAAGAAFCGARSLIVMKHVGMNIAADPLNFIGPTGVTGAMVIVVGTDPGSTCSTGVEDVHWYIAQTNLPLFEPHSVESIFARVKDAFALSEAHQVPVCVFIPTRLCCSAAPVRMSEDPNTLRSNRAFRFARDRDRYLLVGRRALDRHDVLLRKIETISQSQHWARTFFCGGARTGIVTRGLTTGHAHEAVLRLGIADRVHLYAADMTHPLNLSSLRDFAAGKDALFFIEDEDGFLEHSVKMRLFDHLPRRVEGREHFSNSGAVGFQDVQGFLARKLRITVPEAPHGAGPDHVPERIGTFCEGCPHRSAFYGIRKALDGRDGIVGGDIGCSSLPPFLADWLMCMNAGIGISQGMAHVLTDQVVVSTGGDGSFFHTGLLSLQNAVQNQIDLLHIVLDNHLIAMTGHQKGPASFGFLKYRPLLKAIGVKRVHKVSAHHPLKLARVLKREAGRTGVRVVWLDGDCQLANSAWRELKCSSLLPAIAAEKCGDCTECYTALACPAIVRSRGGQGPFEIDLDRCKRCGACRRICPNGAIGASLNCSLPTFLVRALRYVLGRWRS